jgi:23S rRNA (guanosine2251-2'-O)-methyltransferase
MDNTSDNVIFGINAIEELISNRSNEIDRLYFHSEQTKGRGFELLKRARKKKVVCQCVPEKKIQQVAGSSKHQGVVALCPAKPYENMASLYKRIEKAEIPPVILIPASLEDPRNLGALIRTCVAFGVFAILLERKRTTPLNATVAKTSAGMLEHISVVKPANLEKEVREMKEKGFNVVGAIGGSDKKPQGIDFTKPTIVIVGGEHRGIPPYLKKLCSEFTGIPTNKKVQSLNVSVAISILLYECAKQRGFVL